MTVEDVWDSLRIIVPSSSSGETRIVGISKLSLDTVLVVTGRPPGKELSGVASGVVPDDPTEELVEDMASPAITGELLADLLAVLFFLRNASGDHPRRSSSEQALRRPDRPFVVVSGTLDTAPGRTTALSGTVDSSDLINRFLFPFKLLGFRGLSVIVGGWNGYTSSARFFVCSSDRR